MRILSFLFARHQLAPWRLLLLALLSPLVLSGCSKPEPIKIGLLAGLSGKFADLGIEARNGALIAIEAANVSGGVQGRPLILLERDDQQQVAAAKAALQELHGAGVAAVIGPATSSMAMAIAPYANDNKLLLISSTGTTAKLSGIDDYFLRAVGDTALYGRMAARMHSQQRQLRSVSLVLDVANADYTESWAQAYKEEFLRQNGTVLAIEKFNSTKSPDHEEIAARLLKSSPALVVTVCSSVDSALLAQRLKAARPEIQLAGSGWASTGRLIELGGTAVEGMMLEQYFDRASQLPSYVAFVQAYRSRFKSEPGYSAVLAFDAAQILLYGLGASAHPADLKATILKHHEFDGVQGKLTLDDYGDAQRKVYFEKVADGKFVALP